MNNWLYIDPTFFLLCALYTNTVYLFSKNVKIKNEKGCVSHQLILVSIDCDRYNLAHYGIGHLHLFLLSDLELNEDVYENNSTFFILFNFWTQVHFQC